jgi:ADP-ribosylglycohydrolase
MSLDSKTAVVNSALWAAYGDALGFITELADSRTLAYRIKASSVTKTIPWKRRIGGQFGVVMDLPAGCYSDDTQLRLSTCRAIRADGHFDVEAFAKVELPVWLCYALGAGLSTKAAASSLSRENVSWFSNFFVGKSSYFAAGGNGAAMRIQPHVWAASKPADLSSYMPSVLRNSICTHGHPNGLAGAFFHAACLASVLAYREVPGPEQWREILYRLTDLLSIVRSDDELNTFWLPVWRERSQDDVDLLLKRVQEEGLQDVAAIETQLRQSGNQSYPKIVETLGCLNPSVRGSGIKTAILAAALAWLFKDRSTMEALVEAANVLESDTDSIATMVGALLGSVSGSAPDGDLADRRYIAEEAARLYQVGQRTAKQSFRYPDLMSWRSPKTMLDTVGFCNGHIAVAGLGSAQPVGQKWEDRRDKDAAWQWLELGFGQTILARQRQKLRRMDADEKPALDVRKTESSARGGEKMSPQSDLFKERGSSETGFDNRRPVEGTSLDELTNAAINSGFNKELIGKHLVELAEAPNGLELAVAYSAIIVKAKRARLRVQTKRDRGAS